VTPGELSALLGEIWQDKHALLVRHEENARLVGQYDFNNTYQYVIAREEVHLEWIASAIVQVGGNVPAAAEARTNGAPREASLEICADDAARQAEFVAKWRPRVDRMTHARHRKMLSLVLGESVEQQRFFELAAAGRVDLLGRHPADAGSRGSVLPSRWIE
jgi:hypothetical protein